VHRVRVDIEYDLPVVVAEGEVDAFAAPDLEAALEDAARRANVVVDLERVSFMDSTALGLVARAVRLHGEAGGLVRVVLPRGSARRIFEITALDRALPIAASRTEGVAELRR
jgi:anti-sigma B factor antagonist